MIASDQIDLLMVAQMAGLKQGEESWFTWNTRLKRYQVTELGAEKTGLKRGQIIGQQKLVQLRDAWLDYQKLRVDRLAENLVNGKITRRQWVLAMKEALKETYIVEYSLAIGGRQRMTAADRGRLGAMLKEQYVGIKGVHKGLAGFELDLKNLKFSGADLSGIIQKIAIRARMYIDSAVEAFETAKLVAFQPELYQYLNQKHQLPGQGKTTCGVRCRCHLEIDQEEKTGDYLVQWVLDPKAQHCRDKAGSRGCLELSNEWNPLRVTAAMLRSTRSKRHK